MSKEQLIAFWKENYDFSKEVINAFKDVPRENFVPIENRNLAYADHPLPTFKNQTISQPTTVMIMLNALEIKKGQKILEIGTGSGYNTALLSRLVGKKGKIFTTEIIPELIKFARANLKNFKNIKTISTKGLGYEKEAPYDRIIVTAASEEIPKKLLSQLKTNGIMVIPVGPSYIQNLLKIKKEEELQIENLGNFVFVPLKY